MPNVNLNPERGETPWKKQQTRIFCRQREGGIRKDVKWIDGDQLSFYNWKYIIILKEEGRSLSDGGWILHFLKEKSNDKFDFIKGYFSHYTYKKFFFYQRGYPDQLARSSTNLMGSQVNDHVNLQ